MPNRPKQIDSAGNLWCPRCETFLPKESFDKLKRSYHGVQTWCRGCIKAKRIQWHSVPRAHLLALVKKALKRKHGGHLPRDWAIKQLEKQGGRCFYTGIKMTIGHGNGRVWSNVSLDRIDSTKPYSEDNCVLCCCGFNLMKTNLSLDVLRTLAKKFLKHSS